ncbi:hypothetical protein DXF85_24105 [Citrobacter pasteurii]|uniref:Uncharacterized protein n=1 Tax=Citrobacter pasteurii TaxID=1563222 RepID=A0A6N6JX81_9ENTR|nr:hypothetical protein [Citrobacter pasteurii]KAA1272517.1 hypothetical protein DXF85_24105 [Citrobacter pasteurii]
MTMIAGYHLKNGGFLQADILLTSSKNTPLRPFQIPSFSPSVDSTPLMAHTVVGLCQKILVVNKYFAVAFAGSVNEIIKATYLIDKLLAEKIKLTGKGFIDTLIKNQINKLALTAIVLSVEDNEIKLTNFGAEPSISNKYFELYVGGSGAEHAKNYYKQFPIADFDIPEDDIVVHGTCMALQQFANHLIEEYEDQFESESIIDLFGGGFELVSYYNGQFQKISDVVYAYAEAEFNADGTLQVDHPKFLLRSTYQDDHLKIRSVEICQDEEEDEYTTRNDRTFTIFPVTCFQSTFVKDECKDISFVGEFLCFIIKVKGVHGSFTIPFIRKYDQLVGFLAKAFIACTEKDNVDFIYSETFKQELEERVINYMKMVRQEMKLTK